MVPFLGRRTSGSQSPVAHMGPGWEKAPILRSKDGALSLLPGQRRHAPLMKNKGCPPTVCTSARWLESKMAAAWKSILPDALLASRSDWRKLKMQVRKGPAVCCDTILRIHSTVGWSSYVSTGPCVVCTTASSYSRGNDWGAAMSTVIALSDLTGRSTLPPETGDLLWLEKAEGACEAGEWE